MALQDCGGSFVEVSVLSPVFLLSHSLSEYLMSGSGAQANTVVDSERRARQGCSFLTNRLVGEGYFSALTSWKSSLPIPCGWKIPYPPPGTRIGLWVELRSCCMRRSKLLPGIDSRDFVFRVLILTLSIRPPNLQRTARRSTHGLGCPIAFRL